MPLPRPQPLSRTTSFQPKGRSLNKKQKKQVKRLVNNGREMKYFDGTVSGDVSNAAAAYDLTAIAQGDTANSRDGNSVMLRRVAGLFNLTVSDATNVIRVIFLQWRTNSNVDTPDPGLILEDSSNVLSPLRKAGKYSYKIISDRAYALDTYNPIKQVRYDFKQAGNFAAKAYFTSLTAGDHKVYVMLLSDSTAVSHPQIELYNRTTFTDS